MRVGAVHFLGGIMMRMPLWRLPLIEPPRASTMKLTKNLQDKQEQFQRRKTKRVRENRQKLYHGHK